MLFKSFCRWAVSALSVLLAACGGGGGGGSEDGAGTVVLSGVVEDGPLDRSRVFLKDRDGKTLKECGASGVGRCETITDAEGTFFLRVNTTVLSQPLELVTSGGFDRTTGVDFAGMPLRAPIEIFRGLEDRIVVTPLTSILSARIRGSADSAAARREAALDLGVAEGDFLIRPTSDSHLLSSALTLTALAMEIVDSGNKDPFALMGKVGENDSAVLLSGEPNSERFEEWGIAGGAERLKELRNTLKEGRGTLTERFRRAYLVYALKGKVEAALQRGVTDDESGYLRQNVEKLADKILAAVGDDGFQLTKMAPQRIAGYVLFKYNLIKEKNDGSLDCDPVLKENPAIGDLPLESDPRIAELAGLRTVYSVFVPLLDLDELPGHDNLKRLEYFYSSDISPFYHAEKLAAGIFDDRISDPIMLEVVKGKAEAGLFKEVRDIIETQIFQAAYKASAYFEVGRVQIDHGRKQEAITELEKAESHFRRVIDAKGKSLITADFTFMQRIGTLLRYSGDPAGSQRVTNYLKSLVTPDSSVGIYGSIIVGTGTAADEYIAAGQMEAALPLIQTMEEFARETPPNVKKSEYTLQGKIFYLYETARRYADLGRQDKVVEIYTLVQAIRANDGYQNLTAGKTWYYMAGFVELLYRVGETEEALRLAGQIPSPNNVRAIKLAAAYEALHGGGESALALIDARLTSAPDKIEALTFFNNIAEYVAPVLIQAGRMEEARQALEVALNLTRTLTATQDPVTKGYIRVISLYRRMGEPDAAVALLQEAEGVIAGLAGAPKRVESLIAILHEYHSLGMAEKVNELFLATVGVVRGGEVSAGDQVYLLKNLAQAALTLERPAMLKEVVPFLATTARNSFDPAAAYKNDDHDLAVLVAVDHLIYAAKYSRQLGDRAAARRLLDEAAATARQFHAPARKVEMFTKGRSGNESLIGGYAAAGFVAEAMNLARNEFTDTWSRNEGLRAVAEAYILRDDLPSHSIASIDTDGDGRPDFFHLLATPEEIARSGLVMDDDSDGDGIPDVLDRTPFYREHAG